MISEEAVETAVHWLASHAEEAAEAKAQRVYAQEMRKSLKAILMNESDAKTASEREAEAYAHPRYQEHLTKLKAAVFEDEKIGALREAAKMRIEAWRSQQANYRSITL